MCFEKFNGPGPHGTLQVDGRTPKGPSQGVGAAMFHAILHPHPNKAGSCPRPSVQSLPVFPSSEPAREVLSTANRGPGHSLAQSPSGPSKGHLGKV